MAKKITKKECFRLLHSISNMLNILSECEHFFYVRSEYDWLIRSYRLYTLYVYDLEHLSGLDDCIVSRIFDLYNSVNDKFVVL